MREARRSTASNIQIYNMDSGNAMEFLMLIRMNQSFHGGPSLPARQEDSKLQILSLSR